VIKSRRWKWAGHVARMEHHILYRSPNIVRVIKSRRWRWAVMQPEWKKVGVLSKF